MKTMIFGLALALSGCASLPHQECVKPLDKCVLKTDCTCEFQDADHANFPTKEISPVSPEKPIQVGEPTKPVDEPVDHPTEPVKDGLEPDRAIDPDGWNKWKENREP